MAQRISSRREEPTGFTFDLPTVGESIKIAHLSDLHLGRGFDPVAWEHVCSKLEGWKPHVIIISGDLVNNPWPQTLLQAKLEVERLKKGATAIL
jgi:predicted MPP superfamily phosphohydrolase